jgi:hypothetical protein
MTAFTPGEKQTLRQSLLLGTSRRPLTVPSALAALGGTAYPALSILALIGQHRRFERRVAPAAAVIPEAALRLHAGPQPILPPEARQAFLRLADARVMAGAMLRPALRRMNLAGFRPHPFDLPRLLAQLKGDQDILGPAERAYLALAGADDKDAAADLLEDELTPENWMRAPKAQRRLFLRQRRAADPNAARAMLEAQFKGETAAMRAELLGALAIGLGPADRPFLESLVKDRAEAVRAAASALLDRMPGTPMRAQKLAAAGRCFQRQGVTFKLLKLIGAASKESVVFVPPEGYTKPDQIAATRKLFHGLSLPDLMAATGLEAMALLEAMPEDDVLFWTLHEAAIQAGDQASLTALTLYWLYGRPRYPIATVLERLAYAYPAPLSAEQAQSLLAADAWQDVLARTAAEAPFGAKDDATFPLTAALLPTSLLPEFLAMIGDLAGKGPHAARSFAAFLQTLDAKR